jgi:hypothetical protein
MFLKISQPAVGSAVKCLRAISYTPQLLVKKLNSINSDGEGIQGDFVAEKVRDSEFISDYRIA